MVGDKIKACRQSLGLNQADFARKIGIRQGYLSEIERNLKAPGSKVVLSLLRFFPEMSGDFISSDDVSADKSAEKQRKNSRSTSGKDDGGEVSILHLLPERLLQALNDYEKRSDVYMMPALGPQMTPEKIKEGDILLIDPKQEAVEGDWILISTDTGPSIQRYNPSATSLGVVIKLIREPAILRR